MANWLLKPEAGSVKLIKQILDLAFPVECLACEEPGNYLCKNCVERCLFTAPLLVCPECGKPSPVGLTHPTCKHPHGIDGIFAAGSFNNPFLKLAVKEFKYRNLRGLGLPLADFLKEKLLENFSTFIKTYQPTLVPVPLSAARLNFRGYNQSALLTKHMELPFEEILTCQKETKDQTKLNREARIANLKGAFILSGKVKNKNYLVIDDVTTTGATLKECAKVLKRNGAEAVWGIALAFEDFKGS